jgi:superfamily II DNA or RNA helicase
MEIQIDNVWTRISGYYPEKLIQDITSYFMDGAWFSKAWKQGHWDGYIRYAKKQKDGSLLVPTGFLSRITRALDQADCPYQLYDDKRELISPDPIYELYDDRCEKILLNKGRYSYQGIALDKILSAGRGIVKIATGGGKTEVAAAAIRSIGKKSLWLTNRGLLAEQTRRRLQERLRVPIGLVGYGAFDIQDITVLMVQSSREYGEKDRPRLTKLVDDCEVVVGDEVHHLESDEWYKIFSHIKAPWRIGLTATPKLSGPGMSLLAQTEDIIIEITAWDLIERLVLVPPRIWLVRIEEPQLDRQIKWPSAYKLGIVHNDMRNTMIRLIVETFKQDDKPSLTLVSRINHGELLADKLTMAKLKVEWLSGKDSIKRRLDIMKKLEQRELDHVIGQATAGFGEGADYPFLRAIINATGSRGGGDASKDDDAGRVTKQILGRILRRYPGKYYADYVDFVDTGHSGLRSASKARVGTLRAEGYEPFIRPWSEYREVTDEFSARIEADPGN